MKTKFLITLIILSIAHLKSSAQAKFMTQSGTAKFYSSAPLEDIEANHAAVQSIIDLETQEVAVSMLITGFNFKKSLMQEHFNENYLESEKYPKAVFNGTFSSAEPIRADQDGTHGVTVTGELTIHGVAQPLTTTGTITVSNGQVTAETTFPVRVDDHQIDIPKLVFMNIAEVVDVSVHLDYQPFNS